MDEPTSTRTRTKRIKQAGTWRPGPPRDYPTFPAKFWVATAGFVVFWCAVLLFVATWNLP